MKSYNFAVMRYVHLLATLIVVTALLIWLSSCGGKTYQQGEQLYIQYCANCHQENGEGLARLYPPLKGADYWTENADNIACIIRYGIKDEITVNGDRFSMPMTPIPQLTEYEIANIINYINESWYPGSPFASPEAIKQRLESCEGNE